MKNRTKSYETAGPVSFFMKIHEKSYEIVRYRLYSLIFMNFHEKSYEVVRYGLYGLIFMKFHEKSYEIVQYGLYSLIFMKIHERFVPFNWIISSKNFVTVFHFDDCYSA